MLRDLLLPPLVLTALGALAVLPHIVHTLDTGHASLTVEALGGGDRSSRNVALTGLPRFDIAVRQSVSRKDSQVEPEVSVFLPMTVAGASPDAPLAVVVQAYGPDITETILAAETGKVVTLNGVVRDVLWEGLESPVRKKFEENGQPVAPNVVLVELSSIRSTSDRLWAYGVPGVGFLFGLMIASGLIKERKRKGAEAAAPSSAAP